MKLFIQIILILTAIFVLSYYDSSIHGEEYERIKKECEHWNVGYVNIVSLYDSSFYATSRTDTVTGIEYMNALPDKRPLIIGDLISLKGKHIGGDTVTVDFIHFHDGRKWKIILSIIPVIILGVLFFRLFRYDCKTKRIVKR